MNQTEPFATTDDLEAFWRPLNSDTSRAGTLLAMASNYLRLIARNNTVDLDTQITNDTTGVTSETVKMVVLQAVKRAMLMPSDMPEVDQWSQSASPYSESMKFTNPTNDLFFKRNELQLIGLASISGTQQFGILTGARGSNELAESL